MSEDIQHHLITTTAGLEDVVAHCLDQPVIALDTEFMRTDTYYPVIGLAQLSDGHKCWLVDPLTLDLGPLRKLFESSVLHVLHACSEDLEVFLHVLGMVPTRLVDTQVAAAILGDGFSLSYQAFVAAVLGITLDKTETRSDWLARPLSDLQRAYAAHDVVYLKRAWDVMQGRLGAREDWIFEECSSIQAAPLVAADPAQAYLRVKAAWKLEGQELHMLREMCAWRELYAREHDIPRNRIVDDSSLIAVAKGMDSKSALTRAGLHPRSLRKYADLMLTVAADVRSSGASDFPPALPRPVPANSNALMKKLKQHVLDRAKALGIDPQILATRKHLEALLRTRDGAGRVSLPVALDGWRREPIGDDLVAMANRGP